LRCSAAARQGDGSLCLVRYTARLNLMSANKTREPSPCLALVLLALLSCHYTARLNLMSANKTREPSPCLAVNPL